jgi:hypothetical protein
MLPKVRLDIVVKDALAEAVTNAIVKSANTGAIGDGKIWTSNVDSAIRVRTGERDDSALQLRPGLPRLIAYEGSDQTNRMPPGADSTVRLMPAPRARGPNR